MANEKRYIEPGTHLGKPLSWGITDRPRQSGGTYTVYYMEFELLDDSHKGKKYMHYQNLFTKEGTIHPKTAEILMKNMRAIGMTNDDISEPTVPEPKNVNLVFVTDSKDGKEYVNLKYINSLEGAYDPKKSFIAVDDKKKKDLKAAFRVALDASSTPSTTTPTVRQSGFESSTDDDIPF